MKVYTRMEEGGPIFSSCRTIQLGDRWISNPTEEQILAAGWAPYNPDSVVVEPSDEEMLAAAKNRKIADIEEYDSSPMVNIFHYNGISMWFDKATRVGLMNAIQIQKGAGYETTTIWYENTPITIPINLGIQMLSAIELYALECFNVTARHVAEVNALSSVEAVEEYDIAEGYPEVLVLGDTGI